MTLLNSVKQFFNDEGVPFEQVDGKPVLQTGLGGRNGQFMAFLEANEESRLLQFVTLSPVNTPTYRRAAVMELLTRLNWRLNLGCFAMNGDGDIQFRTSIRVGQVEPDHEMLTHLVFGNGFVMDTYFPLVIAVAMADESPERALQRPREALDTHKDRQESDSDKAASRPFTRAGGRLGGFFEDSSN